jgi:hypothetical protein
MLALYGEYATMLVYLSLLLPVMFCPREDAVKTEVEAITERLPRMA